MKLSHNGKGHRALRRLSEGPAVLGELRAESGLVGHQIRKLGFLLVMIRDRGLISHTPGFGYAITQDGLDALACLDAGHDFHVADAIPNVRVFREAA